MDENENKSAKLTSENEIKTATNLIAGILLGLAILGGWWYLYQGKDRQIMPESTTPPAVVVDEPTVLLLKQGSSDEIADIEADLNATDLGSLDEVSTL